MTFAPMRSWLSFLRPCPARKRNLEASAREGKKTGILRAVATRENDKRVARVKIKLTHYYNSSQILIG
jgi:hypothetical protein